MYMGVRKYFKKFGINPEKVIVLDREILFDDYGVAETADPDVIAVLSALSDHYEDITEDNQDTLNKGVDDNKHLKNAGETTEGLEQKEEETLIEKEVGETTEGLEQKEEETLIETTNSSSEVKKPTKRRAPISK